MIDVGAIKKLREETGAGVIEAQKALEKSAGDYQSAKKSLEVMGLEKAAQKGEREVKAGFVASYVHHTGTLASLASVACETDFVARTPEFKNFAKELAMQAAATKTQEVSDLLDQIYIRDASLKISDLLLALKAKLGENIVIKEVKVAEI